MKSEFTAVAIVVAFFSIVLQGCSSDCDTAATSHIEWRFDDIKSDVETVSSRVDILEDLVAPRQMPTMMIESEVMAASFTPEESEPLLPIEADTFPDLDPDILPKSELREVLVGSRATGEKSYSAPRQETRTKTVTVQLPVEVRDVYETIEKTYQVPVTRLEQVKIATEEKEVVSAATSPPCPPCVPQYSAPTLMAESIAVMPTFYATPTVSTGMM